MYNMINHNSNTIPLHAKNTITWKLETVPRELIDLEEEMASHYVES